MIARPKPPATTRSGVRAALALDGQFSTAISEGEAFECCSLRTLYAHDLAVLEDDDLGFVDPAFHAFVASSLDGAGFADDPADFLVRHVGDHDIAGDEVLFAGLLLALQVLVLLVPGHLPCAILVLKLRGGHGAGRCKHRNGDCPKPEGRAMWTGGSRRLFFRGALLGEDRFDEFIDRTPAAFAVEVLGIVRQFRGAPEPGELVELIGAFQRIASSDTVCWLGFHERGSVQYSVFSVQKRTRNLVLLNTEN